MSETRAYKRMPKCAKYQHRAVANGPVGPAMAGPLIEPANFILVFFLNFADKFGRQCYDGVGNMSGQRTCVTKRIQELEPGQSNYILKATRWLWQRAACWSKAPCWCDVDITRRHQTYKVFVPKRRYIPSNQGQYRPTRRQWQNRCSNHVPYQMDDIGRRPG